jgi:prepilin signal peptidase PulO-like enzyme (type II secretory pathway)
VTVIYACLFGLIAFGWISRFGQRRVTEFAIPFLPCLALSGLVVLWRLP